MQRRLTFLSGKIGLAIAFAVMQPSFAAEQQISGKVTADGAQPISGAVVRVQAKGGIQTVVSTTGPDGAFSATGLKTDQVLLSVEKDGRLLFRSIVSTTSGTPVDISLPSPFHMSGWNPSDLTPDPATGVLVADKAGQISRIQSGNSGPSRAVVFSVPPAFRINSIAAGLQAILATANSVVGCGIFRFVVTTRALENRVISTAGPCSGVAVNGDDVYVAFANGAELWHWSDWNSNSPGRIQVPSSGITSLAMDRRGGRILFGDRTGHVYALSLPNGMSTLLTSNAGWVASLTANANHIFIASGNKILLISRSTNQGENPPPVLQKLTGGAISGVAVDAQDRLWYSDVDKGIVTGPLSVP
jgi:Carboxypeptidase regulatory-like domain